jgi:hypothetical protein
VFFGLSDSLQKQNSPFLLPEPEFIAAITQHIPDKHFQQNEWRKANLGLHIDTINLYG